MAITGNDVEAQQPPVGSSNNEKVSVPSLHGDQDSGIHMNPDGSPEPSANNQGYKLLSRVRDIFGVQSQPEQTSEPPKDRITIDTVPNGYPKLGALIAINENYLIFRRFEYLQARLLLTIQDQLRRHERDLIDLEEDEGSGADLKSIERDDRVSGRRKEIMEKIEERWEKYISFLSHASSLALRADPATADYNSLRNFFRNEAPLVQSEIYCSDKDKRDLVALKPRGDTSGVDEYLRRLLLHGSNTMTQKWFTSRTDGNSNVVIYAHWKISLVKGIVLGFALMVLLIGPIYPLFVLSSDVLTEKTLIAMMFTQLIFTCLFAMCLKFFTRPKRHELFGASVAYIGVLIIFMGQTVRNGTS